MRLKTVQEVVQGREPDLKATMGVKPIRGPTAVAARGDRNQSRLLMGTEHPNHK